MNLSGKTCSSMLQRVDYLSEICGGPKKGLFWFLLGHSLLGAGVLGDGLGALRDGVLGQLSGQEEPDGGLDLPGGDGGPLVVVGQALASAAILSNRSLTKEFMILMALEEMPVSG